MTETKLLSCPFCGSDEVRRSVAPDGYYVYCADCGSGTHRASSESLQYAEESWNRRSGERVRSASVENRLVTEHEILSRLFEKYNTKGSGAPGFSAEIRARLEKLETAMVGGAIANTGGAEK